MQNRSTADARRSVLLSFVVLGLLSALIILPYMSRTQAISDDSADRGFINRTESHVRGLENYDIRLEKSEDAAESLMKFRNESGKSASAIADVRDSFVRGEEALRTRVKSLKVEYSDRLASPEVITPDVYKASVERLTGPAQGRNSEVLRNFAKQYDQLVGIDQDQIDQLKVIADYTNPRGNMAFAQLDQEINGVPVFAGYLKAGFTVNGEIVRVINNLAPGLDYDSLSTDFGSPLSAVRAAAGNINYKLQEADITLNDAASTENKVVFGEGDWATTAERMYFPTEIGVARPSWRVLIWQPVNAFYVIVDAETGKMLWRKNITEDQTETATYDVYGNANAYIDTQDSPAPLTPGPVDPTLGTQGVNVPRVSRTLIGNEAPNWGMNDLGWMTDGTNLTDGNNVEAGIDRDGTNGVDAPMQGDGTCPGAGCREFSSMWSPPPGGTDAPLDPQAQRGAVTQMFYAMNIYHDVLYNLGMNEQAFNFQNDNFGRGGNGGDRVSAEGQDSAGTNNANFSTPADGGRGRMQMFVWTGPTPDYDGTTDVDIIIHEVTHGTSNRLHSNTAGLSTNMSRGMGEGWGDWYAHTMLAEPTDAIDGTFTTGGYATYLLTSPTDTSNYYYGIRRFPKAILSSTGGPGNLPHNPMTFADLNVGRDISDGAFPPGPVGSNTPDQVHEAGQIWSSALWEVRALMVTRLGFSAGTTRVLQVVTDGMKLAPIGPTFLQERDAIIAAASALPAAPEASADVADVREGFRIRGMGFSAQVISASPANVVEAFDVPSAQTVDPFSVSDSTGNNNGAPEPGENVLLSIAVQNATGAPETNVTVSVNGGTPVSYGTIPDATTTAMDVPYTVSGATACGAFETVAVVVSSDSGTQAPVNRQFRLGLPVGGPPATFENTTTIAVPGAGTSGPASPYPSTITASGLTGNKVIKVELTDINHTWVDDIDVLLEGPGGQKFIIMSDEFGNTDPVATTITISDGGVDGPMPNSGPLAPGDYQPTNDGTGDTFDSPAPAGPYESPAPAGSATFLSVFGMDGATMNGDWKLWIDDDAGGDIGTIDGGWKITFESDDYTCAAVPTTFENTNPNDVPATGTTTGPAGTYPWTITAAGLSGPQTIKVELTDVAHSWADDMDILLESPSGQRFIMMSDVFGNTDGTTDISTITFSDTGALGLPPDAGPLAPGDYQPSNVGLSTTTDAWDAPAPAGPYESPAPAGSATFASTFGTDSSTMNGDWKLWIDDDAGGDTGTIAGWKITFTPFVAPPAARADFDGDGRTDISVFRPSEGNWYINGSTAGFSVINWGIATDTLVPGDYDGDGKADTAVFRPSDTPGESDFYILNSNGFTFTGAEWGSTGDVPVVGDYDGDGKDDMAIFRDSNATWYVLNSGGGIAVTPFGATGDTPIVGDFDGDGKTDLTYYSAGNWESLPSGGGGSTTIATGGDPADIIAPGDYNGDGTTDVGVFRPSNGTWYINMSGGMGTTFIPWGAAGDIPVPGDYDGDGSEDYGIYRPSDGTWWLLNSQSSMSSSTAFGTMGDMPAVARANP